MKNTIYPSTKLLHVSVHKLGSLSCQRYYFWMYILNMVSRNFNKHFWYGSVLGEGVETLLLTKSMKKAKIAMAKMNKEALIGEILLPDQRAEINLLYQMIIRMVEIWGKTHKKYIRSVTIKDREYKFKLQLKSSPVFFEGTLDARGSVEKKRRMFEIKSAASQYLNNDYFAHLLFDKQVNGYAGGIKKSELKGFGSCDYLVFRKPAIRVRQNESVEEFLVRLEEDLEERQDWYYIKYPHSLGKRAVEAVMKDIEASTFDLYSKYTYLKGPKLLDPFNWPRNDGQCFEYGTCQYFGICKDCEKYPLALRRFRQRDIRYDIEEYELDKTRPLSGPVIKMKGRITKTKKHKTKKGR